MSFLSCSLIDKFKNNKNKSLITFRFSHFDMNTSELGASCCLMPGCPHFWGAEIVGETSGGVYGLHVCPLPQDSCVEAQPLASMSIWR